MKFRDSIFFYFVVLLIVTLAGCSGYEKLLKSSDYELKYEKAFEYYDDEDYARASTLFEQIIDVYNGTNKDDSVNFYYAMCNYNLADYLLAAHHFKSFTIKFGNSPFTEQAEYLNAYCYYQMSPRPSLDQENTNKAIQAFRLYMIRYPHGEYVPKCKELIVELQDKLVEKSYLNAKLYFNLEKYKASIIALNNSLQEYPNTKHREELMFLILKSRYLLASNSIFIKQKERFQATLDEYYSFASEFPESIFKKEAERIFEATTKELNIDSSQLLN